MLTILVENKTKPKKFTAGKMATSELEVLSVDMTSGSRRMVKPVLAGDFIPNNQQPGRQFQMYMRSNGDWWVNISGGNTWLKIYEV